MRRGIETPQMYITELKKKERKKKPKELSENNAYRDGWIVGMSTIKNIKKRYMGTLEFSMRK